MKDLYPEYRKFYISQYEEITQSILKATHFIIGSLQNKYLNGYAQIISQSGNGKK